MFYTAFHDHFVFAHLLFDLIGTQNILLRLSMSIPYSTGVIKFLLMTLLLLNTCRLLEYSALTVYEEDEQ
jgi:hypothetical protein